MQYTSLSSSATTSTSADPPNVGTTVPAIGSTMNPSVAPTFHFGATTTDPRDDKDQNNHWWANPASVPTTFSPTPSISPHAHSSFNNNVGSSSPVPTWTAASYPPYTYNPPSYPSYSYNNSEEQSPDAGIIIALAVFIFFACLTGAAKLQYVMRRRIETASANRNDANNVDTNNTTPRPRPRLTGPTVAASMRPQLWIAPTMTESEKRSFWKAQIIPKRVYAVSFCSEPLYFDDYNVEKEGTVANDNDRVDDDDLETVGQNVQVASYRQVHPKTDLFVLGTQETCEICLEDYAVNDTIAYSANPHCHHVFHEECLLNWLLVKQQTSPNRDDDQDVMNQFTDRRCPVCRQPFLCM